MVAVNRPKPCKGEIVQYILRPYRACLLGAYLPGAMRRAAELRPFGALADFSDNLLSGLETVFACSSKSLFDREKEVKPDFAIKRADRRLFGLDLHKSLPDAEKQLMRESGS